MVLSNVVYVAIGANGNPWFSLMVSMKPTCRSMLGVLGGNGLHAVTPKGIGLPAGSSFSGLFIVRISSLYIHSVFINDVRIHLYTRSYWCTRFRSHYSDIRARSRQLNAQVARELSSCGRAQADLRFKPSHRCDPMVARSATLPTPNATFQ